MTPKQIEKLKPGDILRDPDGDIGVIIQRHDCRIRLKYLAAKTKIIDIVGLVCTYAAVDFEDGGFKLLAEADMTAIKALYT